jgi:hypothetical protein
MGSRLSRPAVHIQAVNAFTDAMATGYRVIAVIAVIVLIVAVAVALLGSAGIGRQQPGLAERGPGPLGAPLPRDQVIAGRGQRT